MKNDLSFCHECRMMVPVDEDGCCERCGEYIEPTAYSCSGECCTTCNNSNEDDEEN